MLTVDGGDREKEHGIGFVGDPWRFRAGGDVFQLSLQRAEKKRETHSAGYVKRRHWRHRKVQASKWSIKPVVLFWCAEMTFGNFNTRSDEQFSFKLLCNILLFQHITTWRMLHPVLNKTLLSSMYMTMALSSWGLVSGQDSKKKSLIFNRFQEELRMFVVVPSRQTKKVMFLAMCE